MTLSEFSSQSIQDKEQQSKSYSLGIVGVRGYVGKELLALILKHPYINIDWVSSRQLDGQSISQLLDSDSDFSSEHDCLISSLSAEQIATKTTDIIVLALPNGLAEPFVQAIEEAGNCKIIIDLSADYRFDNQWIYSVPELDGKALTSAHLKMQSASAQDSKCIKISNPGCYATAMQLVIAPLVELLSTAPNCFGVSGYSGAGTNPSPFNDAENLKDNLIGYKLVEHLHEKEVSVRVEQAIRFSPHVASFFRGINMTVQFEFKQAQTADNLFKMINVFYKNHPLVNCQVETAEIKHIKNTNHCLMGGITVSEDGMRATIISCLDNLLKGAASQAVQNINLALGLPSELAVYSQAENTTLKEHSGAQQ